MPVPAPVLDEAIRTHAQELDDACARAKLVYYRENGKPVAVIDVDLESEPVTACVIPGLAGAYELP